MNLVQANRLQNALKHLRAAIREAEAALDQMRAERDPLALHIFVSTPISEHVGHQERQAKRDGGSLELADGLRAWVSVAALGEWEWLVGAASKR